MKHITILLSLSFIVLLISNCTAYGEDSLLKSFSDGSSTGRVSKDIISRGHESESIQALREFLSRGGTVGTLKAPVITELFYHKDGIPLMVNSRAISEASLTELENEMFQHVVDTSGTSWLRTEKRGREEYLMVVQNASVSSRDVAKKYLFHPDLGVMQKAHFALTGHLFAAQSKGESPKLTAEEWRRYFLISARQHTEYSDLALVISIQPHDERRGLVREFCVTNDDESGVELFIERSAISSGLTTVVKEVVDELLIYEDELPEKRKNTLRNGLAFLKNPSVPD